MLALFIIVIYFVVFTACVQYLGKLTLIKADQVNVELIEKRMRAFTQLSASSIMTS